jgi:hypothetical protein
MTKKILIIGIIIMLISSFLSGCTDNSEEGRFIGTWETEDEALTLVILPDGECEFMHGQGTWEIKNGSLWLVIRFSSGKNTMSYTYSFSNDDKTLTLSDTGGRIWVYTKQ